MKTYKSIYEKIYSIKNLILAWRKARKGKTKRNYVIEFEQNIAKNLLKLQAKNGSCKEDLFLYLVPFSLTMQ